MTHKIITLTGEIVLAPRTRGGFSYSKVIKKMSKNHCFFDPVIEHKIVVWRVVYQNGGKTLYKDLPGSCQTYLIYF